MAAQKACPDVCEAGESQSGRLQQGLSLGSRKEELCHFMHGVADYHCNFHEAWVKVHGRSRSQRGNSNKIKVLCLRFFSGSIFVALMPGSSAWVTKVIWGTNCTKIELGWRAASVAASGIVTEKKNKPVLDETTFGKLLESAYVLQEHNRKVRDLEERIEVEREEARAQEQANQTARQESRPAEETPPPNADYTLTLAEIVEAQRQMQMRSLELEKAMAVVVERVARITRASGAGIGILDGKIVRYRAGSGACALPYGSEVPMKAAVCAASIRTGQVVRSEDVNTEVLFDPEPCRQREILSLLAVPIYQDRSVVGALELYFDKLHGFAEQDIHTCQLMAGLVTEALGRDAERALKKSMAAERSTMLAAIERLQPKQAALEKQEVIASAAAIGSASPGWAPANSSCQNCGNPLMAKEQFCGKCGAPRTSSQEVRPQDSEEFFSAPFPERPSSSESGAAAAVQHSAFLAENEVPNELFEPVLGTSANTDDRDLFTGGSIAAAADEGAMATTLSSSTYSSTQVEVDQEAVDHEDPSTSLIRALPEDIDWSSAARAREFLESLTVTRTPSAFARFWRSRRGDFYLGVALVLVVVVIRWGIWSNQPVVATRGGNPIAGAANRRKQPAPDADLSAFDKLLISLGLAEAPETPEYKGNPDTRVWLDLHTALYYCPGSDLYGKTPKGKITSQRDAQLDQFEPAYHKPCD
jgi:putative methionine-R-sulfoxide reductase with GAF domain